MLTAGPCDEFVRRQLRFEAFEEDVQHLLPARRHCRQLRQIGARAGHDAASEQGHMVARGVQDGQEAVELDAAVPHVDDRTRLRIAPEQRRFGLRFLFEIAADGNRFGDRRSVVEFEEGHAMEGIHRRPWFLELRAVAHIELHDGDGHALFDEKHAHALGVGGGSEIVEFQGGFLRVRRGCRGVPTDAPS